MPRRIFSLCGPSGDASVVGASSFASSASLRGSTAAPFPPTPFSPVRW
jgi:hypothetical protein